MLFHGKRVVSTAFYRGVVGDYHALDAVNAANTCDYTGTGHVIVVAFPAGKLTDLAIIERWLLELFVRVDHLGQ